MGNIPKYEQVRQYILSQIENGILQPGDKLPSEDEYAHFYSVSNITVRKALTELANDGYINRIKGKGSFVSIPTEKEVSSRLIALILSAEDYHDASYMQIIKGAQKMISEFGYSLIVEWSNADLTAECEIISKMISRGVDGFLIYPFDPVRSAQSYELIEKENIPYVLIDRYNSNHPTYFAGCDNYDGAIQATRELLKLKHTKIKFASYHFFLSSEQERFDGYCSAMRQANIPITSDNLLISIDYDVLANDIFSHKVTALFCCNDKLAIKIIENLVKRGIRVPQDVSIFGFDDWEVSKSGLVRLSTMKQDFEYTGGNAANLLINAIQKKFCKKNTKILSGAKMIIRDSTCENPYAEESVTN